MLSLIIGPFIVVLFVMLAGGGYTSTAIMGWFKTLKQPKAAPPNWVFSVVWTILYLLIAISWMRQGYLLNKDEIKSEYFDITSILFYINLILNLCWSIVFFGMQSLLGGIIILLFLIVSTVLLMWWLGNQLSMYLLIPYLLWIIFALYLNIEYYILNK